MSELTISVGAPAPVRAYPESQLPGQAAHALRELARSPIAAIVSLLLPLIFLLVKALTAGAYHGGAEQVIHHLAATAAVFATIMASFVILAHSVAIARERGILKRLRGTPVQASAYLGGKVISHGLMSILGTAVMLAFAVMAFGLELSIWSLAATLIVLTAGIASLASLGVAVALLLSSAQAVLGATMGAFILVGFVSDLFFEGVHLPFALSMLGWALPLRHLVALLGQVLAPGAGLTGMLLVHLAVLVAWTALAANVTARYFGREIRASQRGGMKGSGSPSSSLLRWWQYGDSSVVGVVWGQMRHANTSIWRAPVFAAFVVGFPVVFVALLPLVTGNPIIEGFSFARHMVTSMPVFAVALVAFVALAESLATARDKGVLKRLRGTPLPTWAFISGRTLSVYWMAVVTATIVFGAGWLVHGVSIPLSALPAVLVVLLVGTGTMAALAFAVASLVRDSGAVSAVTLATLLPLKFVSDVFPVGGALPPLVNAIGWVFPLKHMVHAMRTAMETGLFALGHLSVALLWALAAVLVATWRFRWAP